MRQLPTQAVAWSVLIVILVMIGLRSVWIGAGVSLQGDWGFPSPTVGLLATQMFWFFLFCGFLLKVIVELSETIIFRRTIINFVAVCLSPQILAILVAVPVVFFWGYPIEQAMLRTKSQFAAECVDKFVLFCDFWCIALAITGTIYMPRVKLEHKTLWQRMSPVADLILCIAVALVYSFVVRAATVMIEYHLRQAP